MAGLPLLHKFTVTVVYKNYRVRKASLYGLNECFNVFRRERAPLCIPP
jgi:hypothetical protein